MSTSTGTDFETEPVNPWKPVRNTQPDVPITPDGENTITQAGNSSFSDYQFVVRDFFIAIVGVFLFMGLIVGLIVSGSCQFEISHLTRF